MYHEGHEEHEDGIRRSIKSRNLLCYRSPSTPRSGPARVAYEQCLAHELSRNNIGFQLQLAQPVRYKDFCSTVIPYRCSGREPDHYRIEER